MPGSIEEAIKFLETQWSSINENKIKGIKAEVDFKRYLEVNNTHYIPGGWILTPGNSTLTDIPGLKKIALLPIGLDFRWSGGTGNSNNAVTPAQISAYNYFRQVGVSAYFLEPDPVDENNFELPSKSNGKTKANYPRTYKLHFKTMSPNGRLETVDLSDVMSNFPLRNANLGLRCNSHNRIDRQLSPWNDANIVTGLFWFEYARYYCQVEYLVSNNDLDLFVIGQSGAAYPVELKSKSAVVDQKLGDWFGIDIGPFAKMAFFTSNSMNTDALYVVQEVDEVRKHIEWLGIKFTDLVKSCFWVGQAGGRGMMGGASSTVKVPKAAFQKLDDLLPKL